MAFISVPFVSDPNTLADDAILRLQEVWPTWTPADGDLEVIMLEVLAPMASDAVSVASTVPDAVFRQYGTEFFGLAYSQGTQSTSQATIWAVDAAGYRSTGPVEFALESVAFATDTDVFIDPGQTSVVVPVTCLAYGAIGNGLQGSANQVSSFPWVDSILVDPPTSGGSDPETDEQYQDRLRNSLQLQATTLVTGRDFELMALAVPDIGRAMAIVGTARTVTVAVTDPQGELLSTTVKNDLAALYGDYRQVNTTYTVIDPTYTTIGVTFEIETLDEFVASEVLANATQALRDWLDPGQWGMPLGINSEDLNSTWLQSTVVRVSEAVRVVTVGGVRWVQNVRLNGGTADVTLTGTAPLTRPGTITGTVI
jgi:hypothetical protein